jgi:hypothetical protein
VTRRYAQNIVGIWLALGLISLASCAPNTPPGTALNPSMPASVGSASPLAQPDVHFASNAPVDNSQSTALTNYLHSRQLPLVGGRVLAANGGPRQAILYGYVATPFGKADAVDKAREFLNDSGAQVDNRIKIEPDLAGPTSNPNTTTANNGNLDPNNPNNNPDIQKYEDQQAQQQSRQQQQQYMNQGSPFGGGGSPFTMLLPFLMGGFGGGGSSFGFGGGGGGLGMGGGSFGGFGGGMGSPPGSSYGSPYGSSPYPPSGGSPY